MPGGKQIDVRKEIKPKKSAQIVELQGVTMRRKHMAWVGTHDLPNYWGGKGVKKKQDNTGERPGRKLKFKVTGRESGSRTPVWKGQKKKGFGVLNHYRGKTGQSEPWGGTRKGANPTARGRSQKRVVLTAKTKGPL